MADVAFLPIPIALAPAPAGPVVTIAPDAADPFANLLAALGEAAPTSLALAVPAVPATPPVASSTEVPDDIGHPIGADAAADDARKDVPPAPSALGEITAMLALVPPPPSPAPDRTPPAVAPGDEQAVTAAPTTAPGPSADTSVTDPARPARPPADATAANGPRHTAAAELIRALRGGAALGPLASPQLGDPAPSSPPIAPAEATIGLAETPTAPVEAAMVAGDATPVPKRSAAVTRSIAPAAPATPSTPEPATADGPRATRRVTLANAAAPDPLAAPAVRADMRVTTDPIAPAPPDDPVARQLSLTRDGQWLDRLARDIAASGGKDGQLRFRLDPDHLGALTVAITQGADGASVRLTASTEQARAILADAQPRLVAEARAQGLHLREASVDAGSPSPTGAGGGQGGGTRGDPNTLAGQLQQHQQQGRRQPAPETARMQARPAPARGAPDRAAADLFA